MRVETSLVKVVATVALVSLFVALGFWQLNRAEEKRAMRDEAMARSSMAPIQIDGRPLDVGRLAYRKAIAQGRYLAEYQILLDNKVHRGRAGYHVVTPLVLSGTGILLLVDRGWAPWDYDRQTTPHIDVRNGSSTIRGRLMKPVRHAITFEDDEVGRGFEQVWQNLDLDKYQHLTGYPVHGLILQLDPGEEDVGRLTREWPGYTDAWIDRHKAYALQWFGLAAGLLCIFLVLSLKRGPRPADTR